MHVCEGRERDWLLVGLEEDIVDVGGRLAVPGMVGSRNDTPGSKLAPPTGPTTRWGKVRRRSSGLGGEASAPLNPHMVCLFV